jgi:hypothetical protein
MMHQLFTFGIDPSLITMYLDYALYGIIGMVALGFILGFIRGIWREGFRLVFVGGLVIASVIFTRQLVDFFMDFDVAAIASSAGFGTLTLNLSGAPIIVAVTTPYDTIYNVLEQALLAFGFFITPQIAELIIGLTLVLLRYLVFIVLAIIIFFLGETVAAILYFIPFRFIIPRRIRKKVKLRLLGGLAGALKMVLVLTMFLSPFTSLVNTISSSFKNFDDQYGDQIDAALYQEIMAFINAYQDSNFAQTLFSWSVDENGLTIDTQLMNFITGETIEDYQLTLANELGSIVDIAATLIGSGAVDATFSSVDTSLLLTENVVTNLITSITGSTLIMRIIPIAVAIALNLQEVQAYVDPSLINLDAVDWDEELVNIGDILNGVIRSGLLAPILSGNNDINTLIPALFSETAAPEISGILNAIDDSEFLSQVIPAVLYGLAQQEIDAGGPAGGIGISTFLPTAWEDYQSLAIGSELALVYDLVYELSSEVEGFFDVVLSNLVPGTTTLNPAFYRLAEGEEPSPTLLGLIADNFDVIVEILIGEVDANGLPINNVPSSGKGINRASLFDSDLLIYGIPTVVETLLLPTLTGIAGENFDDTELNALIQDFNDGTNGDVRLAYKGEIGGILSILGAVLTNETLVGLLEPTPGETLDILGLLEDTEFRRSLKVDLIPKLDQSQIILVVVPAFLEATLTGPTFDDFLSLISLTTADLNFDFSSLSRELNIIVDMMGYAVNVLGASSDLINQFPTVAYDLIGLLDQIYLSDIINFNPVTENKTTNYRAIIKGIFTLVEGVGIEEADIDVGFNQVVASGGNNGWTTVYTDLNDNDRLDETDLITFAGENFHMINFLKSALDSGILDISGDLFAALNDLTTGSEDLDDPNVAILYKIFALADRSNIIASSFGGILDNVFGTTGGLLDAGLGTSFRNVTSWTEEGSTLLFLVKQLANFADGLNGIDFLNSDVSLIEELLQGLAASQIFEKNDGTYLFPDFLLDQLTGIADLSSYFSDPTPYQLAYDADPADAFNIVREDFYAISNQVSTKTNWYGTKTLITDINLDPILDINGDLQYEYLGGEIENIVGFIAELQSVSIEDLTSGTSLSGQTIQNVLLALNDAPSLRVLVFNVYDSIFGGTNFDIGSLSLSQTNTFVFLELDQAERAEQILATADLLDTIADMGLSGGGSFDIASFNETTILSVGELLTILHDAALFNSFKIGYARANGDLTVFEQAYQFLLTTSTLDTFIYDEGLTAPQREALLYQDIIALTNNFGDGTPDGWNGLDGEIQKFTDIMIAFVGTGIDFANFNGGAIGNTLSTPSGLDAVESLLLAINDSIIIGPAIGQLFGNIFNADAFNIAGLQMSDANTDFFNSEPTRELRAVEISLILDIYADIQSIGLTGGAAFTADLIDPTLFDGLLNKMHDSSVFNRFKPGNSYLNQDLTVFEQTIRMILNTSTLDTFIYDSLDNLGRLEALRVDISALENQFGGSNLNDDWTGEAGEIAYIIGILESFKNTEIDFANFGGDAIGEKLNDEAELLKIEDLLLAINDSTLVAPAIGNLFGNIFESASFNINGLTMADSHTAFFNLEPVKETRATEISLILDIYGDINGIGLSGGAGFTKDMIDPELFDNLLTKMYDSNVFNTFKSGNSYASGDLTVFEQTVRMILNTSTLDTFIYDGEDNLTRLGLLQEDVSRLVNGFANPSLSNDWLGENGEIAKIISILDAFKNLAIADFSSFSGAGSSDVISNLTDTDAGLASIENLLFAMNASAIVYPAIPNLFSNMLNADAAAIGGVTFSSANTRYRGNRIDPNNPQTGDEFLPYDEAEISGLLAIFKNVKEVGTKEYNDLSLLTNDEIDDMQSLLEDLYQSKVFHQEGPSSGVATDLTVFQQMVVMMMNTTQVSTLIFDTNNPNPVYLNQFTTKEGKSTFLVLNFETLFPSTGTTHFTSSWMNTETQEGELTRFFRIFKELKANLPGVGNLNGIDVGSIPPNGISRIMSALNYSSLASDAVPDLVRDAFGFISFATYSEANENYYLTPKQYMISDLNTMDYSGLNPAIVQTGVIAQALNNFYDTNTNAYLDLGPNFSMKDYLDDGNSTFALMDLFARSELFGNLATVIEDPSSSAPGIQPVSLVFKTRALTFYNLLSGTGVNKYFSYLNTNADEKEKKVARIEQIFAGDFDTPFESNRLDQFIGVLSEFTTLTDATSISESPEEMRSLIELTYVATGNTILDRAFLVSELSAGFFTDIFDAEYAKVTDTNAPFFGDSGNLSKRINFYDGNPSNGIDNDFMNLNPFEADGLEGSLRYLNVIAGISDDYIASGFNPNFNPGSERITLIQQSMNMMGSLTSNQVIGTAPYGPTHDESAYDYTLWTVDGNSKIAKLFYASQVTQSPGFEFFGELVNFKSLLIDPFFEVSLSTSPYATNFVFEIEGQKIAYVFA